jgi:hypothetical protein
MCALVVAFFIIAPLVLFYTAGFRYDLAHGQVRETGVLSADALPSDADVYLNNVKLNKKLPIYLPNRAPGTYHIKISRAGYKNWERDITIESKKTTYIKNVVLFKEALPMQILDNFKKQIIDFSSSPSGSYILFTSKDGKGNIYEIDLFNTATEDLNPITRAQFDEPPTIKWAYDEDYALIQTKTKKKINQQIIDANNPEITPDYTFHKDKEIVWSTDNYQIKGDGKNLIVTKINSGETQETKTLQTEKLIYNKPTKEWLAWSPWELWTIYPDGTATLLNRTSDRMDFVVPLDDYGLLLLASENKITGFNPGYYVTHELFAGGKIEKVSADAKLRKIYFLGEVGQKRGVFELEY